MVAAVGAHEHLKGGESHIGYSIWFSSYHEPYAIRHMPYAGISELTTRWIDRSIRVAEAPWNV